MIRTVLQLPPRLIGGRGSGVGKREVRTGNREGSGVRKREVRKGNREGSGVGKREVRTGNREGGEGKRE